MIQPPRGRGLAAGGSAAGVAMATCAGKVPSTPGRAPGGGGGSASLVGAVVRAGSIRVGSLRAGSARAASTRVDSFRRGSPANGADDGAAEATALLPFTLKVLTITG